MKTTIATIHPLPRKAYAFSPPNPLSLSSLFHAGLDLTPNVRATLSKRSVHPRRRMSSCRDVTLFTMHRQDELENNGNLIKNNTVSRRTLLRTAILAGLGLACGGASPSLTGPSAQQAYALNGLRVFPLREPLTNNYYLMRASETNSDLAGVVSVNPVEKLSLAKHGLTRRGADDARAAAAALLKVGLSGETWIWPSVTISAFETAEILAASMRIGRERIVPEFAFLDARGVGRMEGQPVTAVSKLTREHDRLDANWKPELGDDGTPNDSVNDVFVRVRQLMSKLETQYFAQDIIVVAPDSDPLSIWQAAFMGKELTDHSEMSFVPGEVRHVREQVVDAYDKVVEEPFAKTIFKPV